MDVIEIFQVLEIEATKDETAIRNAYRRKLSVTNPEDDPEGFKRLRAAYDAARAYARTEDEAKDGSEETDDTPSGQWVRRAEAIYGDIHTRCDTDKWRELFADDLFLSLEEEENCRFKLLCFLMDHYRLPTEVWGLLNKKLNIVEDVQGLREKFPADFVRYIRSRCERGEDLDFTMFEGEPEAPYDLYLQYYDRCWSALQGREIDQAEELLKNAEALPVFHPVMEVCKAHLRVMQERTDEAVKIMQSLFDRYPEDPMVGYNTAEILWHHGEREEAAAIYEKLKEKNDSHYMANFRLTEWYASKGEYHRAKKCAEKVLSSGADDSFLEILVRVNREIEKEMEEEYKRTSDVLTGLELGWCYLQDGKIHKGVSFAKTLSGRIPEERDAEYKGLMAKLYIEGADYHDAIALADLWEKALDGKLRKDVDEEEREKDRDRLRQSHVIRMQSHRAVAESLEEGSASRRSAFEAALEEGRKALLKGSPQDVGIYLEMAQIYMEMEEYERGLEITQRLVEEFQEYGAFATELEIRQRQWNAAGVVQAGRSCIQYFSGYARAYEHVAKVFLDLNRREDLLALLEEAEKNHVSSVILDAYRYQMTHNPPEAEVLHEKVKAFRKNYFVRVEHGDMAAYEEGLPILTEYLYWYPGTYMLVERALFHRIARHYDEARADFEKALQANPCHPYALNGLSFVYKYQGDYERALFYLKRALLYREEDMGLSIYLDLSDLYSLLGDYENALKLFWCAFPDKNLTDYYLERLVLCMIRAGKTEDAVQKIDACLKDSPLKRFDRLMDVYQLTGDGTRAEELLEEWRKSLFSSRLQKTAWDYEKFYIRAAWQSILFGDGSRGAEYYEKILALARDETNDLTMGAGTMGDAVFLCIVSGQDERGRVFGSLMRDELAREETVRPEENGQVPLFRSKAALRQAILAAYYFAPEDYIEKLLDQEEQTEICHHCQHCVCKEMEAVRIVFLLRQGKQKEALLRMKENLERQPVDEYLAAIQNMCVENGRQIKAPAPSGGQEERPRERRAADQRGGILERLKTLFR